MSDPYKFWKDSLAGKNPPIVNEQLECGFYRMRAGPRDNKWWVGVAIFANDDAGLICLIGNEPQSKDRAIEQWPWFAANPVTEAQ